jgi:hypothetical protein
MAEELDFPPCTMELSSVTPLEIHSGTPTAEEWGRRLRKAVAMSMTVPVWGLSSGTLMVSLLDCFLLLRRHRRLRLLHPSWAMLWAMLWATASERSLVDL